MRRCLLGACLTLVACQSVDIPGNGSLVAGGRLRIFPAYSISYVDMIHIGAVVGMVYLVTDPAAPAWEITETRLPERRVMYALRMKNLHNGGEGEARQVLARRAQALARDEGMRTYRIERYEEAIDSRMFLPHRTAMAEIVLLEHVEQTHGQAR